MLPDCIWYQGQWGRGAEGCIIRKPGDATALSPPPVAGHGTCTSRGAGWSPWILVHLCPLHSFYVACPSEVTSWTHTHPAMGCPCSDQLSMVTVPPFKLLTFVILQGEMDGGHIFCSFFLLSRDIILHIPRSRDFCYLLKEEEGQKWREAFMGGRSIVVFGCWHAWCLKVGTAEKTKLVDCFFKRWCCRWASKVRPIL